MQPVKKSFRRRKNQLTAHDTLQSTAVGSATVQYGERSADRTSATVHCEEPECYGRGATLEKGVFWRNCSNGLNPKSYCTIVWIGQRRDLPIICRRPPLYLHPSVGEKNRTQRCSCWRRMWFSVLILNNIIICTAAPVRLCNSF